VCQIFSEFLIHTKNKNKKLKLTFLIITITWINLGDGNLA